MWVEKLADDEQQCSPSIKSRTRSRMEGLHCCSSSASFSSHITTRLHWRLASVRSSIACSYQRGALLVRHWLYSCQAQVGWRKALGSPERARKAVPVAVRARELAGFSPPKSAQMRASASTGH